MKRQNITGQSTEKTVKDHLVAIGLIVEKPVPDSGVDLMVYHSDNPNKKILLQIKGRGKNQTNKRYRWFQIRTTKKQREAAVKSGLPVVEAWKKKVDLCDFFILVSQRFNEQWVFPTHVIHEIININKIKYGNRANNQNGQQAEMDLDINFNGSPLTERYSFFLGNFSLIKEKLEIA